MKRIALLILVASCGGDDGGSAQSDAAVDSPPGMTDDAAIDGSLGTFTLTSPMLTEGAVIMDVNTCEGGAGGNTSPQLDWTGNNMNAMSFAIVFTDKSNNLVHWVIYDIPASATGLPANVMKTYAPTNVPGAHQTTSFSGTARGYLGPCPPVGGGAHTYEFALHGLDVATLPGASMTTTRQQAVPLITQHQTARALLTGTYER